VKYVNHFVSLTALISHVDFLFSVSNSSVNWTANMSRVRVVVIGAGPAGLCAARHLAADPRHFEFKVFEQGAEVGGTWCYTDLTDTDEYGVPIHSCMYRNLK
jgi:cation diffusion facilitator CzcD-associated flavoprotein CzcO